MFTNYLTILSNSSLKETALNIFEEMGVSIYPSEIEASHRVGPWRRK